MLKKWLVGALAVVCAASLLAGCGGKKESDSKEIKIGGNFELTGNIANLGKQGLNGTLLAIKEINEAGGVLGKQLVLVQADNKSEPSESTNAITKLITQDKVVAVIGPTTSSNCLATLQVSQDNKVPVITPTGTNAKITVGEDGKVKPFAFRTCFIDPFQGVVMANFASNTLKAKTAVIYIDNSSDFSKGLAESFEKNFTKNGGQIVGKEAYLQKDQDFNATLTKIKAMNADVVFVPGYYEDMGKIAKQARAMGITVPLLGGDGWDDMKLIEIAGKEAMNNTFYSNHYIYDENDANCKKFVEAYKKEYNNQEPGAYAVLGYEAVIMLADAIKRANSTDPAKIRDALEQTKDLQVITGLMTLDANHNPMKSAVVIEIKDGKLTFKERVKP